MNDFIFKIIPIIVPIMFILTFVLTIVIMFSSKFRSKLMSQQFKAMKYMVEDNKENIKNITSTMADISIDSKKRILDENQDKLKEISDKEAHISSDGIEIKARALKKGLTQDEVVFCKYCGVGIDNDSKYCKKCGRQQ